MNERDSRKRGSATRRGRWLAYAALAGFVASIPAANWMLLHVGTSCIPGGPCIVPVGFGMSAPSGVLLVGAALVLRDIVQRGLGVGVAVAAIVAGAALSAMFAPRELVVASAFAFLLSELLDLAVFTPLQKKGLVLAAMASSLVGLLADSALFLYLAFGSFEFIGGQVLGKAWMVILFIPVLQLVRRVENRPVGDGDRIATNYTT